MAQAFACLHGAGKVVAFSAGSNPSGIINPKAIHAMAAIGYDLSTHFSKSLKDIENEAPFDLIVTMGCGDACPWLPALQYIDWEIPDPRNMAENEFMQVRDLIEMHVKQLMDGFR